MKVIIIGASGFIGSNIYSIAKKRGYEVIGTQFSSTNDELIHYNIIEDDIFKIIPKTFVLGDDIFVVVCSAIGNIDRCFLEKEYSYNLNVKSTIKLLNSLNKNNIKFAFISSEAVFDGEKGYYEEIDITNPIVEYGKQKLEVERYIVNNMKNYLIFRVSKAVSSEACKGHIFYDFYKSISNNKPIYCIKNQMFSPTYVDDISNGILNSFEKHLFGIYHIANSEIFTRAELARQFAYILGSKIEIIEKDIDYFKFKDNRYLKSYLSSDKLKKHINIEFKSMKYVMNMFANNLETKKKEEI